MKVAEGFTQPAHDAIVSKVLTLMGTDPMDLLPQHRHLLDWDFWELGNGSTVKRQYWVASMESALQASGKSDSWMEREIFQKIIVDVQNVVDCCKAKLLAIDPP